MLIKGRNLRGKNGGWTGMGDNTGCPNVHTILSDLSSELARVQLGAAGDLPTERLWPAAGSSAVAVLLVSADPTPCGWLGSKHNQYIIIIMCIYHALINALSVHMIHTNLNVFYTHVQHSPTKTIYIKVLPKNKKN